MHLKGKHLYSVDQLFNLGVSRVENATAQDKFLKNINPQGMLTFVKSALITNNSCNQACQVFFPTAHCNGPNF